MSVRPCNVRAGPIASSDPGPSSPSLPLGYARRRDEAVGMDSLIDVRRQLRERLLERVDTHGLVAAPRTERRLLVREEALDVVRESGVMLPQRELARIVNEVSDEVVGF